MAEENGTQEARSEETALAIRQALEIVPDVADDPTERMLALIETAQTPEAMNSIWDALPNVKQSEGERWRVHAIRLRESDYENADYYLLLDVTDLGTGERKVVSCGSTMICLQLAKAYKEGWLPLDVEVRGPKRPTKQGYRPLHLHALQPEELKRKAGVS